jgi:hypothetical protein
MIPNILVAGFLAVHAAIHVGFLTPGPAAAPAGPPWPFELGRSWALTPMGVPVGLLRALGTALVIAAVVGFVVAAFSVLNIIPRDLWVAATAFGAAASTALLVCFFHPWLVLGIAVDGVLLLLVVAAGWSPSNA